MPCVNMENLELYTLLGDGALASQCGRCWGLILNISKLNKTSCECKASSSTGMRSHRSELFHARHCVVSTAFVESSCSIEVDTEASESRGP